jgi:hypothetical protein
MNRHPYFDEANADRDDEPPRCFECDALMPWSAMPFSGRRPFFCSQTCRDAADD